MIVALDKFGSFAGIEYMQSSATDVYPNTPTFTFVNATYASSYISFVAGEQLDRNQRPLQTATANETALLNQYDSARSIPFIDFANEYTQVGSQYQPSVLANANWTQIASQLNIPSSSYVCSQSFAETLGYVRSSLSSGPQLLSSEAVLGGQPPSAATARFAPTHYFFTLHRPRT